MTDKQKLNVGSQMRITDAELSLIKVQYAENDASLKLLRKIFLPEISPDVPIGQQIDLWMAIPIDDLKGEDAIINIKARNMVIAHLEMCLQQLKVLAGMKQETVEQTKVRLHKDSSK